MPGTPSIENFFEVNSLRLGGLHFTISLHHRFPITQSIQVLKRTGTRTHFLPLSRLQEEARYASLTLDSTFSIGVKNRNQWKNLQMWSQNDSQSLLSETPFYDLSCQSMSMFRRRHFIRTWSLKILSIVYLIISMLRVLTTKWSGVRLAGYM